ncbi:MAG: archease [Chloroflexi bacterium]|nr:archease [Chloroflexota bacterium]
MAALPFEELPHTADLRLRVTGPDPATLFSNAGQGLCALLRCQAGAAPQPVSRRVTLEADDLETLLVDWLNELLYLIEKHHECYHGFCIERLEGRDLQALALGWTDQHPGRAVKAATYHALRIESGPAGYEAIITLDV